MAAAGFEVSVALEVDSFDVLSYAYSGTNRQVVTRIDVANTGSVGSAGTLVRPRVQVTSNLAGTPVAEWSGAAQALPAPGAPAIIWEDAGIVMNKALIDSLMQTPQAQLVVEILAGDALVSAIRRPLTVLQANQWQHTSDCIDALAGFVQVGDPALDVVLKSVNAILRKRTEFHESQGYSRDAEHVQQVASAVSDVLRDLKIEVTGPAFGTAGATYAIQPPTAILAGKRATALELALVAAACLEKAKLDPVIFLADNHVCAGYAVIPAQAKGSWDAGEQAKIWNKLAPEAVVRHPMALAKLLSLELAQVLDTVGAISDSGPPARTADGKQRHVDVDPAGLKAMLVVRKAWESGISFAPLMPPGAAAAPPAAISKATGVYKPAPDEAMPASAIKSTDKTPREIESNLYQALMASQFSFMGKARSSIREIYDGVKTQYPHLCDDTYLCSQNCRSGHNQPEWRHTVRRALNYLRNITDNPVRHSGGRGHWEILRGAEPPPELEEKSSGGYTPLADEGKPLPDADHEAALATGESATDASSSQAAQGTAIPAPGQSKKSKRDYIKDPLTAAELLMITEAVEVDPVIWLEISHWAKVTGNLKPFQRGLLYDVGKLRENSREPSFKQAYWALIALKEAYQLGFTPS